MSPEAEIAFSSAFVEENSPLVISSFVVISFTAEYDADELDIDCVASPPVKFERLPFTVVMRTNHSAPRTRTKLTVMPV